MTTRPRAREPPPTYDNVLPVYDVSPAKQTLLATLSASVPTGKVVAAKPKASDSHWKITTKQVDSYGTTLTKTTGTHIWRAGCSHCWTESPDWHLLQCPHVRLYASPHTAPSPDFVFKNSQVRWDDLNELRSCPACSSEYRYDTVNFGPFRSLRITRWSSAEKRPRAARRAFKESDGPVQVWRADDRAWFNPGESLRRRYNLSTRGVLAEEQSIPALLRMADRWVGRLCERTLRRALEGVMRRALTAERRFALEPS